MQLAQLHCLPTMTAWGCSSSKANVPDREPYDVRSIRRNRGTIAFACVSLRAKGNFAPHAFHSEGGLF